MGFKLYSVAVQSTRKTESLAQREEEKHRLFRLLKTDQRLQQLLEANGFEFSGIMEAY